MASYASGLHFIDNVKEAERAIVFLTGGLLRNEAALQRLSVLLERLAANRIIYCYDEGLGWNFGMIYGSPEPGTTEAALKARNSIVSHECIVHRAQATRRYEHEAMALRMLSLF